MPIIQVRRKVYIKPDLGTISLQTFPKMNIDSISFRDLNDRIIKTEGDNQKTVLELIHSYYYFGKG
jgi:hypothetical protein